MKCKNCQSSHISGLIECLGVWVSVNVDGTPVDDWGRWEALNTFKCCSCDNAPNKENDA